VEVTHTNFTEVTWMVFVEEDTVVMHTSGVTTTSGCFLCFPIRPCLALTWPRFFLFFLNPVVIVVAALSLSLVSP
jgi:hypothetical protein